MPCHTHERRMETYLILIWNLIQGLPLMGTPARNKTLSRWKRRSMYFTKLIYSPQVWERQTTHSIWGMAGENITYTDMDMVQCKILNSEE